VGLAGDRVCPGHRAGRPSRIAQPRDPQFARQLPRREQPPVGFHRLRGRTVGFEQTRRRPQQRPLLGRGRFQPRREIQRAHDPGRIAPPGQPLGHGQRGGGAIDIDPRPRVAKSVGKLAFEKYPLSAAGKDAQDEATRVELAKARQATDRECAFQEANKFDFSETGKKAITDSKVRQKASEAHEMELEAELDAPRSKAAPVAETVPPVAPSLAMLVEPDDEIPPAPPTVARLLEPPVVE